MSRVLALTRRELLAYFYAPVPYLVLFFFLMLITYFFQSIVFTDMRTGERAAIVRMRSSSASVGPGAIISRGRPERRVSSSDRVEVRSFKVMLFA